MTQDTKELLGNILVGIGFILTIILGYIVLIILSY